MVLVQAALVAALVSSVFAQTSTECQPLNDTCPPDPALSTTHTWNLTSPDSLDSTSWNITNGVLNWTDNALGFTIAKKLDSPTIRSKFYIFWGRMEYHVRAAPGHGVISSVVLQSDDLDEIDWEWVGSENMNVQSNYFGKGKTLPDTGVTHNLTSDSTQNYHNYTTWWDSDKLEWWCDGNLLRTVTYADATNSSGSWYPQTPMTIRIGTWPGGDPSEPKGTIIWAGGEINYDEGPYTMYISQVIAQDFTTGKEYNYTDHSGAWQSISTVPGNSTIEKSLNAVHLTAGQRWNHMSEGARVAIIVICSAVAATGLAVFLVCCIRQRRIGKREWAVQNNRWVEERTEMMNLQADWRQKGYVAVK